MKQNSAIISIILVLIVWMANHPVCSAQTKVIKVNAIESNDYGIEYVLPKTNLDIAVTFSEIKEKAGPYARYASRYLGIDEAKVIMEDQTYYTLDQVSVSEIGVPDKAQSYLVLFKSKTTAPFVYLTEDGLICSINAEYIPEQTSPTSLQSQLAPDMIEINPQSIYTEEYLQAGSTSKMAEVAAKSIYRIRESRQDLLTGETENIPKDGEAMKIVLANLDAQEKLWTELFTGNREIIKQKKHILIEPHTEVNKEVLFRFSHYLGVVDTEDLSGIPVYMNLKDLQTVEILPEDPKRKAKESESIVYNLPGKAEIEIYQGIEKIYSSTVNVTQFGRTQLLGGSVFEDKKAPVRVLFYPHTGGIKQIIQ